MDLNSNAQSVGHGGKILTGGVAMASYIDARQAAEKAADYYRNLAGPARSLALSVEEIEVSEDEKYWLVTLGIEDLLAGLNYGIRKPKDREYKVFKVDRQSGEVMSMKMFKF